MELTDVPRCPCSNKETARFSVVFSDNYDDDYEQDDDNDDDDDVESERSQDAQRVGWAVSAPTTTASTSWSQSHRNMNNGQEIGG